MYLTLSVGPLAQCSTSKWPCQNACSLLCLCMMNLWPFPGGHHRQEDRTVQYMRALMINKSWACGQFVSGILELVVFRANLNARNADRGVWKCLISTFTVTLLTSLFGLLGFRYVVTGDAAALLPITARIHPDLRSLVTAAKGPRRVSRTSIRCRNCLPALLHFRRGIIAP